MSADLSAHHWQTAADEPILERTSWTSEMAVTCTDADESGPVQTTAGPGRQAHNPKVVGSNPTPATKAASQRPLSVRREGPLSRSSEPEGQRREPARQGTAVLQGGDVRRRMSAVCQRSARRTPESPSVSARSADRGSAVCRGLARHRRSFGAGATRLPSSRYRPSPARSMNATAAASATWASRGVTTATSGAARLVPVAPAPNCDEVLAVSDIIQPDQFTAPLSSPRGTRTT